MTSKLRLAIDGRSAQYRGSGVPRYSTELINALGRHQGTFDFQIVVDANLPTGHIGFPPDTQLLPTTSALNSPTRDLWEEFVLPRTLHSVQTQVLHGLSYAVPTRATRFARLATFHDAIVFTEYDMRSTLSKLRLRALLHRVAAKADRIITDSDYSAAEIQRYIPATRNKLTRVWAGVSEHFYTTPPDAALASVSNRIAAPEGFLLYYGGYRSYKNVDRLVEAFRLVANTHPQRLVFVGTPESIPESLHALVASQHLTDRVDFFGYATDDELKALLNRCSAFVFPSAIEGFGLPVAEALACGTPVLCSRNGSLPEIAGDAAVYFDSLEPEAIAHAIQSLLDQPIWQQALRANAPRRAQLFTWASAAAQLAEIYQAVYAEKARNLRR